jgi:polyisoprenoid-binding protein YceI
MKRIFNLTLLMFLAFTLSAQTFTVDTSKSELKWTGKKVGGSHYGQIELKEGVLVLTDNEVSSGIFVIDMNTITCDDLSGNMANQLVGHLKSDDFFSVETYPEATLELKGSTKLKDGKTTVKGDLTIKGTTHPIEFEGKKEGNSFMGKITVDRAKYNVRYGSGSFFENLGDNLIYDDFTLEVKLHTK